MQSDTNEEGNLMLPLRRIRDQSKRRRPACQPSSTTTKGKKAQAAKQRNSSRHEQHKSKSAAVDPADMSVPSEQKSVDDGLSAGSRTV